MQVILLKDVDNLGQSGEVYDVAAGYARNYLVPRGLATVVTKGTLKQLELRHQAEARRREKVEGEAREFATELEGLTLSFHVKVGESERLYGSVTAGDIADAVERETGKSVDRRKIELEDSIRELGTHVVPVKLLPNLAPTITVDVHKEEESDDEEAGDDEED